MAFIGGIDLGGLCDEGSDPFDKGEKGLNDPANLCKGVYFYNGGFIQEVARTTIAAQLEPGGGRVFCH